jgi:hypothetical protein
MSNDYYVGSGGAQPTPEERQLLATSAATSWQNMTGPPSPYSPQARLGFFGSMRAGFQLLPVCWRVLTQQASMLLVPFIVMIIGGFAVYGYVVAFGGVDNLVGSNKYATAIKIFPLAAITMAVSVVGQAVIVAAATDDLNGHRRRLGAAWATACSQLPRLLFFGIVYAGERTVTSMLRGKRAWSPGTIAANLIDRAWDFATFLAIPVLLYEDLPVFKAVKRSGQLVAKRWGVQLTANAVMSAALFVIMLPVIVVGVFVATISVILGIIVIALSVLGLAVIGSTLNGVLSAALYRFATTGLIAPGFHESDMWAPFSQRR